MDYNPIFSFRHGKGGGAGMAGTEVGTYPAGRRWREGMKRLNQLQTNEKTPK